MLEMLHIHIPFLCFPRQTLFFLNIYLLLCKTQGGPCLVLSVPEYVLGDIYDIYSLPYFDTK